MKTGLASVAAALLLACACTRAQAGSAATDWHAVASDDVQATVSQAGSGAGAYTRLQYDFRNHGGYALAQRSLALDFPEHFELLLRVRGRGKPNNLEIKFGDSSGKNVWWHVERDFEPRRDWQTLRLKRRHIDFAWGPTSDRNLRSTTRLEIAVSAKSGGAGEIEFGGLELRPLPAPPTEVPLPVVTRPDDAEVRVDLGLVREFGGLSLHFPAGDSPRSYALDCSIDGQHWRRAITLRNATGPEDAVALPESEARYLRLRRVAGGKSLHLDAVAVEPLGFGATSNDFLAAIAARHPRGAWPRGYHGEQSYWTLVGLPSGGGNGLLSEDGQFEWRRGGPSLEPFLTVDGQDFDWSNVGSHVALVDRYLPLPSVTWQAAGGKLIVDALATGERSPQRYTARYRYRNDSDRPQQIRLALLLRPLQVNPPAQFLNTPGGASPIANLDWDGHSLVANGDVQLTPLVAPTRVIAAGFAGARTPAQLMALADGNRRLHLKDEQRLASAALVYETTVAAHAEWLVAVDLPVGTGAAPRRGANVVALAAQLEQDWQRQAALWHEVLDRVGFQVPPSLEPYVDTLRTATAHILMSRDGAALQPGTRSYRRSWIRDGAMMAAGLMRVGNLQAARDYLDWYTPYVFSNGKVPCCVDSRGSDPVPENDSAGEYLYLVAEVFRHSGDRERLAATWPTVRKVMAYLEQLRQGERKPERLAGAERALYGLMPRSISHEGYSAEPMHSYWDDLWALAGYQSAVEIAGWLDHEADAAAWRAASDEFKADLVASVQASASAHHIDFMPGAAELGDFDPTSSSIAFWPAGAERELMPWLRAAYERYWTEARGRIDGSRAWRDYTPYEWRNVSALLRLGQRERAFTVASFFMADRRPADWNQWAEVVNHDARAARFLGDMPHGWVASDYLRAALDLFAFERLSDQSLVIGAGIDPASIDDDGIRISGLLTRWGRLGYRLHRRADGALALELESGLRTPPGGIHWAVGDRDIVLAPGELGATQP